MCVSMSVCAQVLVCVLIGCQRGDISAMLHSAMRHAEANEADEDREGRHAFGDAHTDWNWEDSLQ